MTAHQDPASIGPVLSVVVPCFNEAATVGRSVARVLDQPFVCEVVIVDDCSTDGTWDVLRSIADPRVRLVRHDVNRGKGAALRTGFSHVTGQFVGIHDADLEYDPADFAKLLRPLLVGDADVVYGSRFLTTEARRVLYFWHSLGNKALTLFSNMMTNLNLTDMETCYKVFRREVLDQIRIEEDRFGVEPELTAKVAAMGVRVYEIGISYHGRSYADGKKIGWKDGMRAVVAISKHSTGARLYERRRRRRPNEFDVADAELAGALDSLDDATNYASWVGEQFAPFVTGRVLEIGAGHGTFTDELAARASELVASDPSERAVDILRQRYAGRRDIIVEAADLDRAVESGPFDTIVLINVLEHIHDDDKALIRLRDALAADGSLCIYVPAFELLYSDFDRQIGHYRRYTVDVLERKLVDAGLEPVTTRYMNAVGFWAWLVTARLLNVRPTGSRLVRPYDRLVIPVVRAVETRVRPPLGQSVVSVSRRAR
ncbi:MAG: bifunctional glycosyltransferase/class I SAM-dependent methyltransferase [Ilumatobacteraceae bacterium]